MKRILVTAIGGQVGHSILKCLEGYDGQLYGTDVGEYPAGIDCVDTFYKVPFAIDEQYIPTLLSICDKHDISHVIPVNEQEIFAVVENKERFCSKGITVLSLNLDQLRICSDKYLLPKKLNEMGLDAPLSYTVDEFCPNGEKYIAKLRNSCGSRLVKQFTTQEELAFISSQTTNELVVQQYIPSSKTEYTIGVFATENEIRSLAFRRELKGGWSQLVELVDGAEFQLVAERIARGLGICGCFNIQLRKHNNKHYIFEINPRISGTNYFRHKLGFQDVRWWLAYASGEKIFPYTSKYTKAIGIKEFNDKIIFLENNASTSSLIEQNCLFSKAQYADLG